MALAEAVVSRFPFCSFTHESWLCVSCHTCPPAPGLYDDVECNLWENPKWGVSSSEGLAPALASCFPARKFYFSLTGIS